MTKRCLTGDKIKFNGQHEGHEVENFPKRWSMGKVASKILGKSDLK